MIFFLSVICALFVWALGGIVLIRKGRYAPWRWFSLGLFILGSEAMISGFLLRSYPSINHSGLIEWLLLLRSISPVSWLLFILTFSQTPKIISFWQPRNILIAAASIPVFAGLWILVSTSPSSDAAWIENYGPLVGILSVSSLLFYPVFLANLEAAFKDTAGTELWRIKFFLLGLAIIFATRIYTATQSLMIPDNLPSLLTLETISSPLGCLAMVVAFNRHSIKGLDLYPSRNFIQGSITLVLTGAYLVIVGVLAYTASAIRGPGNGLVPVHAVVVLLGLSGLAVFFLSKRSSQHLKSLVSRNFNRPQYETGRLWSLFTKRSSANLDTPSLCREFSILIAENFDILSVNVLIHQAETKKLALFASTDPNKESPQSISLPDFPEEEKKPFNLEEKSGDWAETLRHSFPNQFKNGGDRLVVPLTTDTQLVGLAILCDRVNAASYQEEERELLHCIGGHIATALLNRKYSEKLTEAAQLQAFQSMSTFFAHDLKNAANHLNLMLGNLPKHYDNPDFLADALRGISSSVDHINSLVRKLSEFRASLEIDAQECDVIPLLNELVTEFESEGSYRFEQHLDPIPPLPVDKEKLSSVLQNVFINAREASPGPSDCRLLLETGTTNGSAYIAIEDHGCGMDRDFVENSLFRPFTSTKSKGMGIGMYQSKMIVEAHRGSIEVASKVGKGTRFQIILPLS